MRSLYLTVGILLLAFQASASSALRIRKQQSVGETLSVNDPRPLSAALDILEERCRCVITYEDPKWTSDQVVDAPVRHKPEIHTQVPRGGSLSFAIDPTISDSPQNARRFIERAISTAEGTGYSTYRLIDDAVFHVVPAAGSVLAARVSVPPATTPMRDFVTSVLETVTRETGEEVLLAMAPMNLMKTPITASATDEPANAVLSRVLSNEKHRLSWRLFYDVGTKKYYFSIHIVSALSDR